MDSRGGTGPVGPPDRISTTVGPDRPNSDIYRTISVIRSRRYCATLGILYFEYGYLCDLIHRLRPQSHQPAKSKKQGAHAGVLLCSPAKPTGGHVHCSRPATARCRCSCASLCCRMQVKGFKRDTPDTKVISCCLNTVMTMFSI